MYITTCFGVISGKASIGIVLYDRYPKRVIAKKAVITKCLYFKDSSISFSNIIYP